MNGRLKIAPKKDQRGITYLELLRIRSGYSISSLARASKVSRKVLWQIETPKHPVHPRPDTAAKIIEALNTRRNANGYDGCTFEDIFEIVQS